MPYRVNPPIGGQAVHPRILAGFAAAEEAGRDAVFVEGYILYQNRQNLPAYGPWVALAAMAAATSRIRLGTVVTPRVRRRPWKLSRETVTLDHLSGGRLTLSVGIADPLGCTYAAVGEETDVRVRADAADAGAGRADGDVDRQAVLLPRTPYPGERDNLPAPPVRQPWIPPGDPTTMRAVIGEGLHGFERPLQTWRR